MDADESLVEVEVGPIGNWRKERFGKDYEREQRRDMRPRLVESRKVVDQSFSDLGYIGFGDGIDID